MSNLLYNTLAVQNLYYKFAIKSHLFFFSGFHYSMVAVGTCEFQFLLTHTHTHTYAPTHLPTHQVL